MRSVGTPGRADRGISSTVTHALALGITTILISGLLISAGALFEDQRENSAREQLRTVGNRMADDLSRASELAQDGGNVTFRTRHPTTIAGEPYHASFLTGDDCETDLFDAEACLDLELQDGRTSVMVPVRNETGVTFERGEDGRFVVAATANDSAEPPSVPPVTMDLRVGIGNDVGGFSSGSTVNATNRDPIAGFTFTPGQPAVNSTIHFQNDTEDLDGVVTSYEWDLDGDGTVDKTGREFNHSYSEPGKYTVTLTVTDDDGATDSVSKVISVGGLVYEDDVQAINETSASTDSDLNFSVTNHHDAEIEVLEVLIDPRDDFIDALDGGGYDEIEIAGDLDSGGHDASSPIQIYDGGRIIDIGDDGSEGSAVLSSGSTASVWFRGFEDSSGTDVNMNGRAVGVSLRYEVAGTYYTTQFTLFGSVAGNDPPTPAFSTNCASAPECTFTEYANDPDGSIQSWEWYFGDGTTDTGSGPVTHTYPENGTYDVSLTVTDDDGVSSTVTKTVLVGDPGPPVVFAVNAGGNEMTADGITFERDTESNPHPFLTSDDETDSTGDAIANTSSDGLYQSVRYGEAGGFWSWDTPEPFGYDVPVPNGEYEVTVKFAEIDYGFWIDPGDRVFDVELEGSTAINDLDVYATVGDDYALDYTRTVNVGDGDLSIVFYPNSNYQPPQVNAMVVRQLDAVSYQEDDANPKQVAMEAENYHRQVPGNGRDASGDDMSDDSWVEVSNGSASGNTALEGQPNNGDSAGDTENGPRLDYYVQFENVDDPYYVWVRMYCPSVGSADDSIHVGLDGQPATFGGSGMNGNESTLCGDESEWMWASHAAGSQVAVDVDEPGQHTINVWMNDDGVLIDKVVLATDDDDTYAPTDDGPTGPSQSPES